MYSFPNPWLITQRECIIIVVSSLWSEWCRALLWLVSFLTQCDVCMVFCCCQWRRKEQRVSQFDFQGSCLHFFLVHCKDCAILIYNISDNNFIGGHLIHYFHISICLQFILPLQYNYITIQNTGLQWHLLLIFMILRLYQLGLIILQPNGTFCYLISNISVI